MTTKLGLDIGAKSIGWCLYDDDTIRDIGVRIFSDGRDPKTGTSLAVDRRDARSMRRRRDRYLGRRSALVEVLVAHGSLLADKGAAKSLHAEDPYELRTRALDHPLTPHQIGRALFHLNQRRGFKSNRKTDRVSKDAEGGKIASGSKALDQAMAETGARTLGEFLHKREVRRIRMRPDADGYDFYPDRTHYEEEFEKIWSAQAIHHPALLTEDAKAAIHRVIFYQRQLKAQVVGNFSFAGWYGIPDAEKRLPKSHPLFQQRRLYEEVNQLEIVAAGAPARKLTLDERNALILKLQDKNKVTFDTLQRLIKLKESERFNNEGENRKDLVGDEVRAELMHKDRFGPDWTTFSIERQSAIIERLVNEEDTAALLDWLQSEQGVGREAAENIANAHLPEGHDRFGITATTALLQQLKADVVTDLPPAGPAVITRVRRFDIRARPPVQSRRV